MSNRIANENRSFRGSNVYLTTSEKEALKRAIDQYYTNITAAEDKNLIDFFEKYDQEALASASKKLSR